MQKYQNFTIQLRNYDTSEVEGPQKCELLSFFVLLDDFGVTSQKWLYLSGDAKLIDADCDDRLATRRFTPCKRYLAYFLGI